MQQRDREPPEEPFSVLPPLEAAEEAAILERVSPRALIIHEAIRREGEGELARPSVALAWSGLAAGLSMGFTLVSEGLLRTFLPDASWSIVISKFGYTVGFLVVILGRQQLFTENTLIVMLPLFTRRDMRTLRNVLRLWVVVLMANLAGAVLFSWIVGNTNVFEPEVRETFSEIGREALAGDFGTILLRGIFAGWMIALTVWLMPAAEAGRVWIIIIITYIVGLAGLAHIIAGSIEVLYLVNTGQASWADYFGWYMPPTLIGNIIGGVSLVALLNYAQVAPDYVRSAPAPRRRSERRGRRPPPTAAA